MREVVPDKEVDSLLETIQPQQVMSYLDAHGWSERRQLGDKAVLWQYTSAADKRFEVLLPLDRGLLDFPLRMDQALYNIALAEQRSQLAVLRDIATSSSDIIRVRVNL